MPASFEIGRALVPEPVPGQSGAHFAGSRKQAVRVRVSYTDGNTGAEVVVERVFEVDVVDDLAWTDPVRDPDVVAEIRDLKLQQTKERIYELLNEGRGREARFLLERLNLDMEELMHLGLSPRNFDRMAMQVNSMMASAGSSQYSALAAAIPRALVPTQACTMGSSLRSQSSSACAWALQWSVM